MPGGRPTKLTQELIDVISAALVIGNYIDDACGAANITRETFYAWKRLGEEARRIAATPGQRLSAQQALALEFSDATAIAISRGASQMLIRIHQGATQTSVETRTTRKVVGTRRVEYAQASDGTPLFEDQPVYAEETTTVERPPDPKLDIWRLEHRFPDKFRTAAAVELTGPEGGPISIEARAADAASRLRELQARRPDALPPAPDLPAEGVPA